MRAYPKILGAARIDTMSKLPAAPKGVMLLEASVESASQIRTLLERESLELAEWQRSGLGWGPAWQKLRPEIVIVDYLLAKQDGLQCIEKFKGLDASMAILFTHAFQGMRANEIELKAIDLGASSVLQKPFGEARFLTTLRRLKATTLRNRSVVKLKTVVG